MSRGPTPGDGAAPGAAPDRVQVARWRARLDTLTRWCLAELPVAAAVVDAVPTSRPTLGDLLRRALGRDGAGVVDLLDALDAGTPAARALVGRVLGADLLLVVVAVRAGTLVRADARACRTAGEARAVVDAFLGGGTPEWLDVLGVAEGDGARVPVLTRGTDGRPSGDVAGFGARPLAAAAELTIVLPFIPLDRRPEPVAAEEPMADEEPAAHAPPPTVDPFASLAAPAILGGTLRPGAAFLDAPGAVIGADEEEDGTASEDDADDAENRDAEDDASTAEHEWGADEENGASDDVDDDDADDDADDGATAGPHAVRTIRAAGATVEVDEDRAVDHGEALDRLRARTSAATERVSMLVASDDGVAEHVADAAAWLADASEQELRAVARGGWSGDCALEVALAVAEDDPEALDVVQVARRHEAELVVEIDARAAVAWLARHRPDAARRLGAAL